MTDITSREALTFLADIAEAIEAWRHERGKPPHALLDALHVRGLEIVRCERPAAVATPGEVGVALAGATDLMPGAWVEREAPSRMLDAEIACADPR